MMLDTESQLPSEERSRPAALPNALSSDDSLRRLIALAARAVDMAHASVSLYAGSTTLELITTPGYDEVGGNHAARLDATVAGSGRPLAVPDLADRPGQGSPSGSPASGAYIGVPVLDSHSTVTGVLHVLDPDPRPIVDRHIALLSAFGGAIGDHLELRAHLDSPDVEKKEAADVAQAIRAGQIVPWYQPIVDLSTGTIIGMEALARRTYPDGRIENPAAFVPIAERSGLIVDLDVAVARVALKDLKRWQRSNPALRMSVNISGRHLDQDGWVDRLRALAAEADLLPTTVQLEITETTRPLYSVSSEMRMQLARSLGFTLWLDDFGSGWSGLRDLLRLPVDGIKIDRNFAAALGTRVDSVLVRALTTAATELEMKVTIEGIERPEQVALARELGCHYGQGFLWSAPVSAAGVDQLFAMAER